MYSGMHMLTPCKPQKAVFVAGLTLAPAEVGPKDEELATNVIQRASQLGVTLINTADNVTNAGWAPGGAADSRLPPMSCAPA